MANKKKMSPTAMGLVGAAVGAAVGAGAVVLSQEKNRKKIGKKFNELKDKGQKAYSDMKDKVEELSSQGEAKVEEAKRDLKSRL